MDQRWTRLPLPVIFLLFWRNADGFKDGTYSDAHHGWGLPSDAFSPHGVQSSVSEVHVTGILPVEEVGSSLFPNKPLKSKSKLNLLQFVKGGSSNFQSTSHAQTAYDALRQPQDTASQSALKSPSSYESVSLSSPQAGPSTTVQGSRKQLTSTYTGSSGTQAGSSTPFILQGSTAYVGSPQPQDTVSQFAPGSPSSYPGLSLSSPQAGPSTTVQGSRKQLTSIYRGSSGTQTGSSSFSLQESTAYGGSHQPQDTASQSAPGSQSYASVSLSSPQAGPSTTRGLQKQFTSAYQGSSGAPFGASTDFASKGMSHSYSGSVQSKGTTSQFSPVSSPYASISLSSPQAGPSTTVQGSRKQLTSTYTGSSGTQAGSSTPFILHGSTAYGASRQPQDTASQSAPKSPSSYASVSLSSPQAGPSTTVQGSRKQLASTYMGSSGTQTGSSSFSLQESTDYGASPQPQDTVSQFAPGSPSSYPGFSLSSPQAGPSIDPGSVKQFSFTLMGNPDTKAGSSTPFTLQGSTGYGGSPQPQDTASQFAPGSPSSYPGLSLSSPQAGPSIDPGSVKQFTFTLMGSPDTQAGSSTPFILQGSTGYGGSPQPQDTTSQFAPESPSSYPGLSLSSPQAGPSTVLGSRKQLASTYMGSSGTQAGSPSFSLQGSTDYGASPQPQDTVSQFAPGSPSSYPGLSLSSPQAGPSTVLGSLKQLSFTFTRNPGTQAGFFTPFTLQGSITYDGSLLPQGSASQFAPVSPSYPSVLTPSQGVDSQSTIPDSLKKLTSTFAGNSGTQAGSSTPFALQGGTTYGGSSQPQDTTSWSAPGPHSSYASASLSSPQAGPSTNVQGSLKRLASTFVGSYGTQAGSSTAILQGTTAYGGSSQPQDSTSWSAPGPHSSYASASLSSPQAGPSTVQASQKQFTSAYQGSSGAQSGASTGFASQGMSSSSSGSVQSQGTTSQFAPGSPSSYLGLSLSSPQAGPSTNVQGSLKRLASTFVGSSGTQAGSSTAILQGSTAYGGSSQPQDATSRSAPGPHSSYASVSLSSPQAVAGPGTAQSSQKQFISTSTGSSGKLL
ncbi:cell wall protein AWA1-like isoform X1 [Cyprinus carpio]|uniref:Cell wall protein AWA1-like isoform X1 n=1 Tax=Cyprinus carpio TaxID=7962 RepID=A0A9R0B5E8_CYPCA|nr:cell wall protein AWA1-like isoform X1 [Cyprinus carpio]